MSDAKDPEAVREARRRYLLHQAARSDAPATAPGAGPTSLEGTLSDISAEVTAEAIERREREGGAAPGR